MLQCYLKGACHGLYGPGTVVYARRSDGAVVKGEFYTIESVMNDNGSCGKTLELALREVEGSYSRNTFRVNEECLSRMA